MLQCLLRNHTVRCNWKHKLPTHSEKLSKRLKQHWLRNLEKRSRNKNQNNHIHYNRTLLATALFGLVEDASCKKSWNRYIFIFATAVLFINKSAMCKSRKQNDFLFKRLLFSQWQFVFPLVWALFDMLLRNAAASVVVRK